jgi:hypothetical protein
MFETKNNFFRGDEKQMNDMATEGDNNKPEKLKKDLSRINGKLERKKAKREDLEYRMQKQIMVMNQDWRKYNQEFHSGFNQFEIKDSFRTHLLLDTPDYFLRAEHDLALWRDQQHGG